MNFGRYAHIELLHPACIADFKKLYARLLEAEKKGETKTSFRVFETYRSPMRQQEIFNQQNGTTGARAWNSAHQYGFAVDFVPQVNGKWSWDENHDWRFLNETVQDFANLFHPFKWDLPHVVHRRWYEAQDLLITRK